LAVAASVLLAVGGGALLMSRDDERGQIATGPGPSTTPAVEATPPPATSAATLVDGTVSVVDESAPATVTTPIVDPPVPNTAQFESLPSVDGTVVIPPDSQFHVATFSEYARVPFDVDPLDVNNLSLFGTQSNDTLWAANVTTGEVVVFDPSGQIVGSTSIPTSVDDNGLIDVAVGPANSVYALYLSFDTAVTVVASALESPSREIRRWSYGADLATSCEANCSFRPVENGFAWEGELVPYVNESGDEIVHPADPGFATDWELTEDGPPGAVTVTGPLDEEGTLGEPTWSLRLEQIVFNSDLHASFQQQTDGSFVVLALFEPDVNVSESRRSVFLWLRSDGTVAAIDADSVEGLTTVLIRPDGPLIGVVENDQGFVLGTLTPG
jgi:hypothetical protein